MPLIPFFPYFEMYQIQLAYHYMDLSLGGIHYFQTYYQNLLLLAVSIAMIGWMFALYQQIDIVPSDSRSAPMYRVKSLRNALVIIGLICCFVFAQRMSLADGVFLVLPVFCWYPVKTFNMLRRLNKMETWFWIGGIELLVSIIHTRHWTCFYIAIYFCRSYHSSIVFI